MKLEALEPCISKFFLRLDFLIQQIVQDAILQGLPRKRPCGKAKSLLDHVWKLGKAGQPVTAAALARVTRKSSSKVSGRLKVLCAKGQLKAVRVSGKVLYLPVLGR